MASSPLTNTPTDVMFEIFDLLTIANLCNFRQTCRWAKDQSSKPFATRGYKEISTCDCSDSTYDLANTLKGNKDLASSVKTFGVQSQCQSCQTRAHGYDSLSGQPCKQDGTWAMSDILSALPNLETLVLHTMSTQSFARHFQGAHARKPGTPSYATGSGEWHLATVSLHFCSFTSEELKAIARLADAEVTHFNFNRVVCIDGKWSEVLCSIRDAAKDGSSLNLSAPMVETVGAGRAPSSFALMPKNRAKFFKAMRGEHGIEAVTVQEWLASMKGKRAIKLGVDMITQYVTSGAWH
ncbi:hypothetical protein LTR97_007463 [Elasticomyces elasticus]|uniref:F-box domain-containing protein n=1 Tax=Elasticomyces elasticus TaxID=574655 RepID=A0AAN7ZMU0_9PEZI|nr:hypothetical protein LTR97_007463 [Elasticomyces elasticus]